MLDWEQRFSHADGPVRSWQVINDMPAPASVRSLSVGSLTFGPPRAFNNQSGPLPKERRKTGVGRRLEPIGPCVRSEGHIWKSKGADPAGTRLVYCPHCRRATTAQNAGAILPPIKPRETAPIVPAVVERECTHKEGHEWYRAGKRGGKQRIMCRFKDCKLRSYALPAAESRPIPCAREDR